MCSNSISSNCGRYRSLLALAALLQGTFACVIQGHESGECVDFNDFESFLPFCRSTVRYRACMPKFQELYSNHTISAKDDWVRQNYERMVDQRLSVEQNRSLARQGVNEHGIPGSVAERFSDNEDCQEAYRNYFCWLNFPRCDAEDRSLLMCRSVCENFFKSCRYSKDMYRCGNPQYYGGDEPESGDDVDENGIPIYWRAQFPGQPFKTNEFDGDDNPIVVCTPSIKNGVAGL